MALTTDIEWCDSTLNLMMGCDGCELWDPRRGVRHCYAGVLTERRTARGPKKGWPLAFDQPMIFPERLDEALGWCDLTGTARSEKPWLDGRPRLVFLNNMGDTFTASLSEDWLAPFLPRLAASPHHWLILTKRPAAAARFARRHPLPLNVWLGASLTSALSLARLRALQRAPAALRFLSCEPLLGPLPRLALDGIAWVIVGGESGPGFRPMALDWVRDVRDLCQVAGISFFFKQVGGTVPKAGCRSLDGRAWSEIPPTPRTPPCGESPPTLRLT